MTKHKTDLKYLNGGLNQRKLTEMKTKLKEDRKYVAVSQGKSEKTYYEN